MSAAPLVHWPISRLSGLKAPLPTAMEPARLLSRWTMIRRFATAVFNELRPEIDKIKLPEGTSIEYGGEYESQNEVFIPMIISLGISVAMIFFILLFQFKKEKLSLLIISLMLLTFPGAILG